MVGFVFRYMCFTLSSVSRPEDECSGPAGIHLPIHSLSTPSITLTNSFAALKSTWLHMITLRTKKNIPIMPFPAKWCIPSHPRLLGELSDNLLAAEDVPYAT